MNRALSSSRQPRPASVRQGRTHPQDPHPPCSSRPHVWGQRAKPLLSAHPISASTWPWLPALLPRRWRPSEGLLKAASGDRDVLRKTASQAPFWDDVALGITTQTGGGEGSRIRSEQPGVPTGLSNRRARRGAHSWWLELRGRRVTPSHRGRSRALRHRGLPARPRFPGKAGSRDSQEPSRLLPPLSS